MEEILVVSDMKTHALFMKWILSEEGYKVHIASSGREALKLMKGSMYHLILLDMLRPEIDGITFLKKIGQCVENHNVTVVVVSSKISRELIRTSISGRTIDHIVRPYNVQGLINKIALGMKALA